MTLFARNFWNGLLLIISDLIMFILSMYIASAFLHLVLSDYDLKIPEQEVHDWRMLHIMLAFICITWFGARLRHYFYRKTFWFELKEVLRTLVIFAVVEIAVMAFAKWSFSRYLWVLTWFFVMLLIPCSRAIVKKILENFGIWQRETIIIGSGKNANDAYRAIKSEKYLGLNVVKFITSDEKSNNEFIGSLPIEYADESWLNSNVNKQTQFILALEAEQGDVRNRWLRNLMIGGYRYVSVIPTLRGMPLDSTDMSFIFSHEVMIFRVHNNLAKWSSRIIKRVFDIFGSAAIIFILSPILIYIAAKVRKDGGNAIYGHERIGKDGKSFKCLKFRSMVMNSKEVLEELIEKDMDSREEWLATFKLKNDPRITKIGAFLRKSSLDELPQLFNVLRGEMSLVGPRPIIQEELERYSEQADYYLLSKPGMTGLWQVSGRSDVDYDTRVYLDAWYVKNWSMWNDVAILFKTIGVVLKRDGAY